MSKKSKRGSKLQAPPERIPEMLLKDLVSILKDRFAILSDYQGQPHWVRFKGIPYNSFSPDCRSIRATAHHRGTSRGYLVSPIVIKQVLAKFGIEEREFIEAYKQHSSFKELGNDADGSIILSNEVNKLN